MNDDSNWFEDIWEHREEVLYPDLFGTEVEGIFPIPYSRLEAGKISDPRWGTCGVFRFAPTPARTSWLCVSSGLSNAWFDEKPDPSTVSGFGCEFILETPTKVDWPIQRLHQMMTLQIGYALGKWGEAQPLTRNDRIPIGSPIDFATSTLTDILLAAPTHVEGALVQDSGTAIFIQVVGVSFQEVVFAKQHGSEALINRLRSQTSFPVTNPQRQCVIQSDIAPQHAPNFKP
ncbi:MAG: suppressor of fused domain protein [Verrucomicrobiota bacterium]